MKNNTINNLFYDSVLYLTNKFGWKNPFKARKLRRLLKTVEQSKQHQVQTILTTNLQALENTHSKNIEYPTLGSPGDHPTEMMITVIRDIFLQLQTRHLIPTQPIDSPVGLVFQLQYKSNEANESDQYVVSLEVIKRTVEARTRQFQASWDMESHRHFDKDLVREIYKALVDEIVLDLTADHLNMIDKLATKNVIKTYNINDNIDSLAITLFDQCNQIAKDTRRGSGNWIVIPENKILLQYFFPNQSVLPSNGYTSMHFVGVWKDIDVYVGTPLVLDQESILVGYKGKTTEIDGGVIYSPYVLVLPAGVEVDSATFTPHMKLITRFGFTYDESSQYYYRKITLTSQ